MLEAQDFQRVSASSAPLNDRDSVRLFLRGFKIPILSLVAIAVLGLILDLGTNAYIQLITLAILVNMVMAMSLNLISGFTGQFSMGHAGFMAIGAYVSAWTSMQPEVANVPNVLLFLALPLLSGLAAGACGFIVGLPSLRLKGDYLAIITLGFAEIIRVTLLNIQAVGGARGLYGIPGPQGLPNLSMSDFLVQFLINSFWTLTTALVLWRLVKSGRGLRFLSVREDEIAAEAMGIDITSTKVRAFVISSFFAGVGGSLFAHSIKFISPATFTFARSVDFIIMVVLGGLGSLSGSALAALFITTLPELVLRELQKATGKDFRMIIYSALLILFMILRPSGIMGQREVFDFFKAKLQRRRKGPAL